MKKLIIGSGILITIVIAAFVLLMGNINPLIKAGVEKAGPVVIKAPVNLSDVDISFFSGSGELKGLKVGNPEGYTSEHAFYMDKLIVELDPKSVTSDKIHIKNIIIEGPQIIFEGGFSKSNLSQLQENADSFIPSGSGKNDKSTKSIQKSLLVDHVIITNGNISVYMDILKGKKLTVPLPTLELHDIGKTKDASISDVIGEILASINGSVLPAVKTGAGNISQELNKQAGALKEQVESGVQEGMGKLKGLFGK